jgi:hypothetical protein
MCRMKLLQVYQTGPLAPIYMGLLDETPELSDEDRALADRSAEETLAEIPEIAPEDAVAERGDVVEIAPPAPEAEIEESATDLGEHATEVVWDFTDVAVEVAPAGEEDAAHDVTPAAGEAGAGAVTEEPAAVGEQSISSEDLMNERATGPVEITEMPVAPAEEPGADDVTETLTERDMERATLPTIPEADDEDLEVDSDRPTIPGPMLAEDEALHPSLIDPAPAEELEDEPLSDEVTDDG